MNGSHSRTRNKLINRLAGVALKLASGESEHLLQQASRLAERLERYGQGWGATCSAAT